MTQILAFKLPVILFFLGFILILEGKGRFYQYFKTHAQRWQKHGIVFVITGLVSLSIVVPITEWASEMVAWRASYPIFDASWVLFFDLLILDLWIYFWHRANHRFDFLWRFHEIHHLDQDMDATTALRFHFGEVILSVCFRAIVMLVLDIPLLHIMLFEVLVMCSAIFHHSRLKLPRWVEKYAYYMWVTPRYHHTHHHAKVEDLNSHFATLLPIWDRIFKTYHGYTDHYDAQMGVLDQKGQLVSDLPAIGLLKRPFARKIK